MNKAGSGRRITRPPSSSLCDLLAARIDAIPRKPLQAQASLKWILRYCEGEEDYETSQNPGGMWMRLAAHPTLGVPEAVLAEPPWAITPKEFQCLYAPEIAFVQRTADLFGRGAQEAFDRELGSALEDYIDTPSPRGEAERIRCVIQNRAASCPLELENFLWALWQGGCARIFESARQAVEGADSASLAVRAILAESFPTELAMARSCLQAAALAMENRAQIEADGLEAEQTFDRWRWDLLRTYALVRVRRGRLLTGFIP